MFTPRPPTQAHIQAALESQRGRPLRFVSVGCTRTLDVPRGFNLDQRSVVLGNGKAVLQRGREALLRWAQFDVGFVELCWPGTTVAKDAQVAVVAHTLGLYSVNVARVVEVEDAMGGPTPRFAVTYATTPHHVECGEERFCVELDPATATVRYHLVAISRPNHALVWLGYPYARHAQARFARGSLAAMQRATRS